MSTTFTFQYSYVTAMHLTYECSYMQIFNLKKRNVESLHESVLVHEANMGEVNSMRNTWLKKRDFAICVTGTIAEVICMLTRCHYSVMAL